MATVEFTVKKSGSSTVTLTDAVIVNDGMDYNIYSDMSASATVTAAAKTTSSGGGGGGGGGSGGADRRDTPGSGGSGGAGGQGIVIIRDARA